ncbi:hypothetical protein F9385_19185 [Escherichia coli]|nr:hypothetical protein [Escherichia coli]EHK6826376.1 hypothetical protein [Escherichia coli]EKQ6240038.1 hypothetical protein [Escherichia coli]
MTKVTTRCGASSKPEFSTGHPITKAFLPHQRVTTEGKAMRKVRCVKDRYIWEGSDRKKVTDTFEGVFHGWGCDYEEFENGPGNYSVGIVELEDGSVQRFIPESIKFIE